ncbi:MAG: insulinase family protein, partial [Candidatus Marinimicrobia bacterium]|nr:insulinase family protein [Candidatus Neomarinimicrobiota bacterium]
DAELKLDPKITRGQLANGLTYYIRQNAKPEQRAELRLVVNVGSVLENEEQQGLAHFLEHMAFNGTKHFKKHEIISFMESAGMRFGSHLNAYTSFDETVYMLTVPTDQDSLVETGFKILADWATGISLEAEEIDNERGVIREEWRLGRGAEARIRDLEYPVMFYGSLYARRLPIGQIAVVDTFQYETLRKFYRDWYRPDLMAVVAVGDFDETAIKNLIERYFADLPLPEKAPARFIPAVPDHEETLFSIQSDPELTRTIIRIINKLPINEERLVNDYRRTMVENLYNGMLGKRLDELSKDADPPFLQAISHKGRLVRSKDYYYVAAIVKEDGIERGLSSLLAEIRRVQKYGFTDTEFERLKSQVMRNMEQSYRERENFYSGDLADEFTRNFLLNEPAPGIEIEYELYKKYLFGITLDEINALSRQWISDKNRVVLVSAPQKAGLSLPTKSDLIDIINAIRQQPLEAYVDQVVERDLLEQMPKAGRIISESRIDSLDVTELQLSNGARVIIKPTDFKNDEILLSAFSPGGTSLVPDSNYIAAASCIPIIRESGLGEFTKIALNKKLAGKVVSVNPGLGELTEQFSASASPKDLVTMFQLIYLYFTTPRRDSSAYLSYRNKMLTTLANRNVDPFAAFNDTVSATLSQHHFRARPWSVELLDEMDLEKSYEIFRERFAEAGDFTFILVGNVQIDTVKQLIVRYLASLPTIDRIENWRDVGMRLPEGVVYNEARKGIEQKSFVQITFHGPFEWNHANRFLLTSVTDILRIKLREQVREEKGGTYGVRVNQSAIQYPHLEFRITIQFGCNPERAEELTTVIFNEVEKLKSELVSDEDLTKIKQIDLRTYETNLKENRFWLNNLYFYYFNNEDPLNILNYPQLVAGLTKEKIQNAAQCYLPADNHVRVILYPEN